MHQIYHLIKSIAIILFVLIIFFEARAQRNEIEKLNHEFKEAQDDSVQIMAMYQLYKYYYYSRIDSALYYAKNAYNLSKKTNDYELGKISMALGHAYLQAGDYENSIKYLTVAYDEAKKQGYEQIYSVLLSDIGLNYHYINDNEKALQYLNKALDLSVDYNGKIVAYFNLAQIMSAQKKYTKSKDYYGFALELAVKHENIEDEAIIYNRMGQIKTTEKEYKEAIKLYEKSYEMIDSSKRYYQVANFKGLAESYLFLSEFKEAIYFAKMGDSIADKTGFIYEKHLTQKLLSEIYDSLKQHSVALHYYKKYAELKDSILNKESKDQLNYLHVEFQTREKEMQLEIMHQDAALKNKMLIIYVILSVLVVVVLLYFIKNGRLMNKVLRYEKEKETLKKQRLKEELNQKKRELLSHVMQISQQRDILLSIQEKLGSISKSKDLDTTNREFLSIKADIKVKLNQTDNWEHIKMHFENVHPHFFKQIKEDFPSLSTNDLKLCAYSKLNLSGKETSQLLNINLSSVQMARYRLKKKMNIEEELSLDDFILSKY